MSEVEICNQALAYLGEQSIRSLDETTRRAGFCNTLYPVVRDSNLAAYDWSFARKVSILQQLDETHPEGYVYKIPSDCITPLGLLPRGQTRTRWKAEAGKLIIPGLDSTQLTFNLYLQYTRQETNTALFSMSFIDVLALDLAVRMSLPITRDRKMAADLKQELRVLRMEMIAEDANRGDEYRFADEDPENDTFVNPMGTYATVGDTFKYGGSE